MLNIMKYRLAALLLLIPVVTASQLPDMRLPISLDADATDYDGRNSMLRFRGLKLTQGNIGIVADEGRATKLDFQDSVWKFSGNVVIDVENGHIESETADLKFSDHQLTLATITGNPATFELKRIDSEEVTYAEAGNLVYDLAAGTIEFSGNARITEGGNQISSELLVYNILEQRINAQGSQEGDGRVRIIYTPPEDSVDAESDADAEDVEVPEESP